MGTNRWGLKQLGEWQTCFAFAPGGYRLRSSSRYCTASPTCAAVRSVCALEVRDRSGHPTDLVVRPGRQVQFLHRLPEQQFRRLVQPGQDIELLSLEQRVRRLALPRHRDRSRLEHARADLRRRRAAAPVPQLLVRHARDLHVDVDAIEQRTAELPQVPLHLAVARRIVGTGQVTPELSGSSPPRA
jgi:hypothetical protein